MKCIDASADLGTKRRTCGKLVGISLLAVALRILYVRGYLFGGGAVRISPDDLCQLYFGGVFLEYSFDLIAVSVSMLAVFLETVVLSADLLGGLLDNVYVLLARVGKRKTLYRLFIRHLLKRNILLLFLEFIWFLLLERQLPTTAMFPVLGADFLLLTGLDFLCVICRLFFKNEFSYVLVLLAYFFPILVMGFGYAFEKPFWTIGNKLPLQWGLYNWYFPVTYQTAADPVSWTAAVYGGGAAPVCMGALLCAGYFFVGRLRFCTMELIGGEDDAN